MAQINVSISEEAYRKAKAKSGLLRIELKEYMERIILENTKDIFLDKDILKEIKQMEVKKDE